ncbi:MAG: hypothetical protein ABFD00_03470 [Chloroherpetonaceae bacterium]
MKEQKNWKFLRIGGEYLEEVLHVMTKTNRNVTGAAAYLISNESAVYQKEREIIKQLKENGLYGK